MERPGGKVSGPVALVASRSISLLPLALILWGVAIVVFVALPGSSFGRTLITVVVYWSVAIFTLAAVGRAVRRTERRERTFWVMVGGGLSVRFVGYASWLNFGEMRFVPSNLAPHDLAYGASYLLILVALIYLVGGTMKDVVPLSPLDVLSVMLSASLLVWYFVLGPAAAVAHPEGWREVATNLFKPVGDMGLLFLSLVVFSGSVRPPFAGRLVGALIAFLVADGLYVGLHSFEPYEFGRLSTLFWALGIMLFGLAACRRTLLDELRFQREISSWRVFSFWLGPLSPAIQYGFLLIWAILHPPIPTYIAWAGAIFVLYFAVRTSVLNYVTHGLRLKAEAAAKREEQSRISGELHDTVKQSVNGIPLMLKAYRAALRKGATERAEEILDHAEQAAREASHRVSCPIEELKTRCRGEPGLRILLQQLVTDIEGCFGIEVHEDMKVPLASLDPEEEAAIYRIISEAFWNAAKHAGASHVWIEFREVGSALVLKVCDDGRGFSPEKQKEGFGIQLMRTRALEIGARLELISEPHRGITVQLRLERK